MRRTCLLLLFCNLSVFAQDRLTVKEAAEITYQAKETVKAYQLLLNFVAFAENAPNELKEGVENSYSATRNQIFLNKEAIIEDDIDPENKLGRTRDLDVERYLNTLDIQYEKDIEPSITFDNLQVSHVKRRDYIYVKVYFESSFSKKYKKKETNYPMRQRLAILRAEKKGSRWFTYVSGIQFYDPNIPIDNIENDALLVTETDEVVSSDRALGNTDPQLQNRVEMAIKDYETLQQESKKKLEDEFKQAIKHADQLYANQEFEEAESAYRKARELNPFNTVPLVQLIRVKKELTSRTYESYMAQAERAKKERRYEEAMDFYQKALQRKPQSSDIITRELHPLSQRINDISSIRNKMEVGKINEAIDECDRRIRDKRRVINDYPEFFLLRGRAYLLSADRRAKERALEDFNKAIEIDSYYQEARLIRADYLEHNNNAVGAITDYDVALANIPVDKMTIGERANIITKKIQLKTNTGNLKGAIEEYEKLIKEAAQVGAPRNANHFYEKGVLEFKKADVEKSPVDLATADKSLGIAISLNNTFTKAYFMRGLVRFDLEKYRDAAKDFAESEKLGLDSASRTLIQSKSDVLYQQGLEALAEMKLDKAEKAFRNAIVIRPKNASAWFKKGETLYSGRDFDNAIEHFNTAIGFRPNFPEAHYKNGLALSQLGRYEEAIGSFGQAIQQNKQYVEAYQESGKAYQKLSNYKMALSLLQNALGILQVEYKRIKKVDNKSVLSLIKSRLSSVYFNIGECHYETKSYAEAIKVLDVAIENVPDFADAYYYRGLTYMAQGKLKDAIKNLSKGLEYFPENAFYRYAVATALFRDGTYAESVKNYTTVLRIDSLNTLKDTKHRRGLSFYKMGNYEKALKDFSEYNSTVLDNSPEAFLTDFGFLYLQLKQDSLALQQFQKILTKQGQNPQALYGMACAYDLRNNKAEAIQFAEKALLTKSLTKAFVSEQEYFFLKNIRKDKLFGKRYSFLKKKNLVSNNTKS